MQRLNIRKNYKCHMLIKAVNLLIILLYTIESCDYIRVAYLYNKSFSKNS